MKTKKTLLRRGFTLIELLTVIAVIGILASILIPTVGAAKRTANKAKTKAQFGGYVNAIQQFKSQYGYWPTIFTAEGTSYDLNTTANTETFVETLSGRDISTGAAVAPNGNRKASPFYSFAEAEFELDADPPQLVDAFGNPNIKIYVDYDGDGKISVPDPDDPTTDKDVRVPVAIYSEEAGDFDTPVFSYE